MMAAQDQLEREYIRTKEEHRALEMQNYIGLSRNTGTFDPDRSEVKPLRPAVCVCVPPLTVHACVPECSCVCVCRLLEGDIFRTGMILEDVKETIDRNVCDQLSPPRSSSSSSSTPAPSPTPTLRTPPSLGSPRLPAPSPPPSQHAVIPFTSSFPHC